MRVFRLRVATADVPEQAREWDCLSWEIMPNGVLRLEAVDDEGDVWFAPGFWQWCAVIEGSRP